MADPKMFESFACYLNFNNDLIKFQYFVDTFKWKGLTQDTEIIQYETLNSNTKVKTTHELPIIFDNVALDSKNSALIKIEAGFEDILLNLLSPHKKVF